MLARPLNCCPIEMPKQFMQVLLHLLHLLGHPGISQLHCRQFHLNSLVSLLTHFYHCLLEVRIIRCTLFFISFIFLPRISRRITKDRLRPLQLLRSLGLVPPTIRIGTFYLFLYLSVKVHWFILHRHFVSGVFHHLFC